MSTKVMFLSDTAATDESIVRAWNAYANAQDKANNLFRRADEFHDSLMEDRAQGWQDEADALWECLDERDAFTIN